MLAFRLTFVFVVVASSSLLYGFAVLTGSAYHPPCIWRQLIVVPLCTRAGLFCSGGAPAESGPLIKQSTGRGQSTMEKLRGVAKGKGSVRRTTSDTTGKKARRTKPPGKP